MSIETINRILTHHNNKYSVDSNILYLDNFFLLHEQSIKKIILYQLIDNLNDNLTYKSIIINANNPFFESVVVITNNSPNFKCDHDKVTHVNFRCVYGIQTNDIFNLFKDDCINVFIYNDIVIDYIQSEYILKMHNKDVGLLSTLMFNKDIPDKIELYNESSFTDNDSIISSFSGLIINGKIELDTNYYVSIHGFQNFIIQDLSKNYDPINVSNTVNSYLFRYREIDMSNTYFTNIFNINCPFIISVLKNYKDYINFDLKKIYDLTDEAPNENEIDLCNSYNISKIKIEDRVDIELTKSQIKYKFYNKYKEEYDSLLEKQSKKIEELTAINENNLYKLNELKKSELEEFFKKEKDRFIEELEKTKESQNIEIESYKKEQYEKIDTLVKREISEKSSNVDNLPYNNDNITSYCEDVFNKKRFEMDEMIKKEREEKESELNNYFAKMAEFKNMEIESAIRSRMDSLDLQISEEQKEKVKEIITLTQQKYEEYFLDEQKKLDVLLTKQKNNELKKIESDIAIYKKQYKIQLDNLLIQKQHELENYNNERKTQIAIDCEAMKNNMFSIEKLKFETELIEKKQKEVNKLNQYYESERSVLGEKLNKIRTEKLRQIDEEVAFKLNQEIELLRKEKILQIESEIEKEAQLIREEKLLRVKQEVESINKEKFSQAEYTTLHEIELIKQEKLLQIENDVEITKKEIITKLEKEIELIKQEKLSQLDSEIKLIKREKILQIESNIQEEIKLIKKEKISKTESEIILLRKEKILDINVEHEKLVKELTEKYQVELNNYKTELLDSKIKYMKNIQEQKQKETEELEKSIIESHNKRINELDDAMEVIIKDKALKTESEIQLIRKEKLSQNESEINQQIRLINEEKLSQNEHAILYETELIKKENLSKIDLQIEVIKKEKLSQLEKELIVLKEEIKDTITKEENIEKNARMVKLEEELQKIYTTRKQEIISKLESELESINNKTIQEKKSQLDKKYKLDIDSYELMYNNKISNINLEHNNLIKDIIEKNDIELNNYNKELLDSKIKYMEHIEKQKQIDIKELESSIIASHNKRINELDEKFEVMKKEKIINLESDVELIKEERLSKIQSELHDKIKLIKKERLSQIEKEAQLIKKEKLSHIESEIELIHNEKLLQMKQGKSELDKKYKIELENYESAYTDKLSNIILEHKKQVKEIKEKNYAELTSYREELLNSKINYMQNLQEQKQKETKELESSIKELQDKQIRESENLAKATSQSKLMKEKVSKVDLEVEAIKKEKLLKIDLQLEVTKKEKLSQIEKELIVLKEQFKDTLSKEESIEKNARMVKLEEELQKIYKTRKQEIISKLESELGSINIKEIQEKKLELDKKYNLEIETYELKYTDKLSNINLEHEKILGEITEKCETELNNYKKELLDSKIKYMDHIEKQKQKETQDIESNIAELRNNQLKESEHLAKTTLDSKLAKEKLSQIEKETELRKGEKLSQIEKEIQALKKEKLSQIEKETELIKKEKLSQIEKELIVLRQEIKDTISKEQSIEKNARMVKLEEEFQRLYVTRKQEIISKLESELESTNSKTIQEKKLELDKKYDLEIESYINKYNNKMSNINLEHDKLVKEIVQHNFAELNNYKKELLDSKIKYMDHIEKQKQKEVEELESSIIASHNKRINELDEKFSSYKLNEIEAFSTSFERQKELRKSELREQIKSEVLLELNSHIKKTRGDF